MAKHPPRPLTIGRLAQATGVGIETVRYYERLGLMPAPPRTPGGARRYDARAVTRLRFIKRAQALGFTLKEVAELLALEGGECREVRRLAEEKRHDIERRVADLTAMGETLDRLIAECRRGEPGGHCAIVEALSADDPEAPQ